MSKVRVAIVGASGYTGLELLKLLLRHPHAQVTALASRRPEPTPISQIHPQLTGQLELNVLPLTPSELADQADVAFGCLPHAAGAALASELLMRGMKVIDLSADFRLRDPVEYQKWYGIEHPAPGLLATTPYGLPERYREQIRGAQLVANPGCYPTSAILALAPLLDAKLIESGGIVVDSKSGVTGGGRDPKPAFHYPECNESLAAYGVGNHRHMPEIDQALSIAAGTKVETVFTPHLVPMDRGILSTCYATPTGAVTTDELQACLHAAYRDEPFVHVVDTPPATKHVVGTNRCHLTARAVRGRVVVVSVIDNLLKGASGAAVQNFNLVCGFDETTSLR